MDASTRPGRWGRGETEKILSRHQEAPSSPPPRSDWRLLGHGAAVLLYIAFQWSGWRYFLDMGALPVEAPSPAAAQLMEVLTSSGWLSFFKAFEIAGSLIVLFPATRALGLLVLGPIIINVLSYHLFLGGFGGDFPAAVLATLSYAVLFWTEHEKFLPLLPASLRGEARMPDFDRYLEGMADDKNAPTDPATKPAATEIQTLEIETLEIATTEVVAMTPAGALLNLPPGDFVTTELAPPSAAAPAVAPGESLAIEAGVTKSAEGEASATKRAETKKATAKSEPTQGPATKKRRQRSATPPKRGSSK